MQVWQVIQILCRQSPRTRVLVKAACGTYADLDYVEEHYPRSATGVQLGRHVVLVAEGADQPTDLVLTEVEDGSR